MEEERKPIRLRCQRVCCDATFTFDDNPEGSCQYHDSDQWKLNFLCTVTNFPPIFHGGKEWSCCKKRSHDFSLFLEIPGCKTGKHTTEKPVTVKPVVTPKIVPPSSASASNASAKDSCSRCHQGFFCSDHGSQAKEINPKPVVAEPEPKHIPAPPKKIVGINEPQICKHKGCGQTFKEKDNHDAACNSHPGPEVFHD